MASKIFVNIGSGNGLLPDGAKPLPKAELTNPQWDPLVFIPGWCLFNTLRPRQDGRYFADDVLKCIFLNENVWISLKIPLKFVPRGPINNIPALFQIMAWRQPGDKPLFEPMLVLVPTHICVTQPQWVKCSRHQSLSCAWNVHMRNHRHISQEMWVNMVQPGTCIVLQLV